MAARDAALQARWGSLYPLKVARAWSMVDELPPRLVAHADAAGQDLDEPFLLRLYALWERKHREAR